MAERTGTVLTKATAVVFAFATVVMMGLLAGCSNDPVWTSEQTDELSINVPQLSSIDVTTEKGSVHYTGEDAGDGWVWITVTKKAAGLDRAAARAAMAAIEIVAERAGDGKARVGWRWRALAKEGWAAQVSFAIKGPVATGMRVRTDEGAIEVKNVRGDVDVLTKRGDITVKSSGGDLLGETHEGRIEAVYEGTKIKLHTHSGMMTADLSRCAVVGGLLKADIGSIELAVGPKTSFHLSCKARDGTIQCDAPLRERETKGKQLKGILGEGVGALGIRSEHGSVTIRMAD